MNSADVTQLTRDRTGFELGSVWLRGLAVRTVAPRYSSAMGCQPPPCGQPASSLVTYDVRWPQVGGPDSMRAPCVNAAAVSLVGSARRFARGLSEHVPPAACRRYVGDGVLGAGRRWKAGPVPSLRS